MGRRESLLIPFLRDALKYRKYSNLKYDTSDIFGETFIVVFPQKTCRLKEDCQMMFRDWYRVKGKSYRLKEDYTTAKQAMEAALRKSDFLGRVIKGPKDFIYRFLSPSEVAEKKRKAKEQKKAKKANPYSDSESTLSPQSSGYGSGSEHSDEPERNNSPGPLHGFNGQGHLIKLEEGSMENLQHGLLENFSGILKLTDGTEVLFQDGYALNVAENGTVQFPFAEDVPMAIDQSADANMPTDQIAPELTSPIQVVQSVVDDNVLAHQLSTGNELNPKAEEISLCKNLEQMQLGTGEVCASESPPVANHGSNSAFLLNQLESIASDFPNLPDELLPDTGVQNSQDPVSDGMGLNPTFDASMDDVKLLDEMLDYYSSCGNHSGEESQLPASESPAQVDIMSYKTKSVTVYECFNRQDLPGMIVLICQPKVTEFCVTVAAEEDSSKDGILDSEDSFDLDDSTKQLIFENTLENMQLLSNGHLLVTLQCKEPINNIFSLH